jgi:alkaline phosphatase
LSLALAVTVAVAAATPAAALAKNPRRAKLKGLVEALWASEGTAVFKFLSMLSPQGG